MIASIKKGENIETSMFSGISIPEYSIITEFVDLSGLCLQMETRKR